MPTEKTRSDAQTVFPNLRSSQSEVKSRKPPPQSPLPPGVMSDAKRGSTSPLGGVAKPAERKR
jgi:hypothetical protein